VIDGPEQGKGVGRAAVRTLVEWLARCEGCREVRLSYHPDNLVAAGLYASPGFQSTEVSSGDEAVAGLSVAT